RVRLRRDSGRPPQRARGVRRLVHRRGRAFVLQPVFPEHVAIGDGRVPARGHPLPAARAGLAVGRPPSARGPGGRSGRDEGGGPRSELARSARGLRKSFGAVVAARAVNTEIPVGQRVSLIGSNGAGKTTFVNMVTGYLRPDAGTIRFDGRDIVGL